MGNKTLFDNDPANFGYQCFGPYLTRFCQWIQQQKENMDPGVCLLFVARDGYLFQKIHNSLYPENKSHNHYVLASRAAIHYAAMDTKTAVLEDLAACRNVGTVREALLYRFHLLDGEPRENGDDDPLLASLLEHPKCDLELTQSEAQSFLEESVTALKTQIASRARRHKEFYKKYLEDIIGERYPMVVDIGYQGRTQLFFSQILQRDVGGLYLVTHDKAHGIADKAGSVRAFDGDYLSSKSSASLVNEYRYFFEAALSAPQGSFLHFDSSGKPVHEPHLRDQRSGVIHTRIHQGVLRYTHDYIGKKKAGLPPADEKSLRAFLTNPSPEDAAMFSGLAFNDLFMGGTGLYIVLPQSERKSKYALWIEGQLAADRFYQPFKTAGKIQAVLTALERFAMKRYLSKAHFAQFATNRRAYLLETDDLLLKIYGRLTLTGMKKTKT